MDSRTRRAVFPSTTGASRPRYSRKLHVLREPGFLEAMGAQMAGTEEGDGGLVEAAPPLAEVESGTPDDIWQQLKKHLAALAAGDQSEPRSLDVQSLSSFLSLVTEEMASKSTFNRVQSLVPLWTEDVMRLNACLCKELAKCTRFLSTEHPLDTSDVLLISTELTTQTLRCCIRILPLIDCCNTGMSAHCAASLKAILQQICSPATLHNIRVAALSGSGVQGTTNVKDSKCTAYETPGCTVDSEAELSHLHSMRVMQNVGASHKLRGEELRQECSGYEQIKIRRMEGADADCHRHVDSWDKESHLLRMLDHQVDIICGMLEVYIDELLSHPDLSEVFLWTQDEEDRGVLSFSRQMEIVLEAACVHALVSWRRTQPVHRGEQSAGAPSLTLTAAVMLLDIVTEDVAHRGFLTHIANLVRRSVDTHGILLSRSEKSMDSAGGISRVAGMVGCDEMLKFVEIADPAKPPSWFQGDISWSMQYKIRSPDLADSLHPRVCVHLTLSILESAVRLYAQADRSSCLCQHSRYERKMGGISSRSLCSLPESCRCSCCSDPRQTDQLCASPVHVLKDYHLHGDPFEGSQEGCMSTEQEQEFVASMLHLISSALYRIAAELHRTRLLSVTSGHTEIALAREIQITLSCVSAVFQSSLPGEQQNSPAGKTFIADTLEDPIVMDLEDSMRYTWKVLSDLVRREMKRGVPDHLLDEYFYVLQSLVALVREGRGQEFSTDGHCAETDNTAHPKDSLLTSLTAEPDEESQTLTGLRQPLNSVISGPAETQNQMSPATLKIFEKLKGRKPQYLTSEPRSRSDLASTKHCDQVISSSSTLSSQERSSKRSRDTRDVSLVSTGGNPYVQSCIVTDKSLDGDSFDDLNDFIVCKKGRNYVKWKKERQKFVERRHARNIWRRMEEREKLLVKLANTEVE